MPTNDEDIITPTIKPTKTPPIFSFSSVYLLLAGIFEPHKHPFGSMITMGNLAELVIRLTQKSEMVSSLGIGSDFDSSRNPFLDQLGSLKRALDISY